MPVWAKQAVLPIIKIENDYARKRNLWDHQHFHTSKNIFSPLSDPQPRKNAIFQSTVLQKDTAAVENILVMGQNRANMKVFHWHVQKRLLL